MPEEVTILLAEDDRGHAELLQLSLRREGWTQPIVHLSDGRAAECFLFREGGGPHRRPGERYVLILDMQMPKVDGQALLERIRADAELQCLPVVVFTTANHLGEMRRCYQLGCCGYVVKPVDYGGMTRTAAALVGLLEVIQVPALDS